MPIKNVLQQINALQAMNWDKIRCQNNNAVNETDHKQKQERLFTLVRNERH